MKKTSIVLAALTAMLSTVSCLKENGSETVKYTPMTFCAESKGMNTESSKAEMAYRYDLLWQENDEILVKNASESAVFKLVSEPETIGTSSSSSPQRTIANAFSKTANSTSNTTRSADSLSRAGISSRSLFRACSA